MPMNSGKKVLVAGYPKSGNTWLGYMVSYLLGAKYIDLHAPDSKVTLQKEILKLIDGSVLHKTEYEQVCKTHNRYNFLQDSNFNLESYDKVIFIVRDPRDVAVSDYFFKYYNVPVATNKPEKILTYRPWMVRKLVWKMNLLRTARNWTFHTISWRTFEGKCLIRYEDLKKDSLGALQSICNYLNVPCEMEILQDALRLFDFEKLSGGRKPGEEYQTAFFRKGVIGDYENYFDVIDKRIMNWYAADEMKSLGYKI